MDVVEEPYRPSARERLRLWWAGQARGRSGFWPRVYRWRWRARTPDTGRWATYLVVSGAFAGDEQAMWMLRKQIVHDLLDQMGWVGVRPTSWPEVRVSDQGAELFIRAQVAVLAEVPYVKVKPYEPPRSGSVIPGR